ncbi:hypothetical protein ACIRU3_02595 [Streptomyces sp. NPDC101151]|uniref:hypothetical protein n=1 Tax=Streptomyces sp. NPDC101151 TaxID=3366115 RepID=UPI003822DF69
MAVLDGTWWSVWWGAMAWWLAAFAGLVVLGVFAVLRLHRLRRHPVGRGLPVYLDNAAVMDLYKMGNHTAALRKEVEERRSRTIGCLAVIPLVSLLFRVKGGSEEGTFVKYVQKSEPIMVIGLLLSVLESQDALVEVRLRTRGGTVTPNRALVRELARRQADEDPADGVVLSEIGEFVMVTGRFEAQGGGGETLVMRAPYREGEAFAHLRVVLRREGLRRANKELPGGQFQAHCLGKVTSWDPRSREAVLEQPIAVFL